MSVGEERWAAISSRPGYEASTLGRVRSVDRVVVQSNGHEMKLRGKVLALQQHPNGYVTVGTGAEYRTGWLHRLVLEAFAGPCPAGLEACHGPGGQADNRLVNLRWDTRASNLEDMRVAGTHHESRKTHCPVEHPLAHPNLVASELPSRKCKACNRAGARAHYLRNRGVVADFREVADAYYQQIVTEAEEVA